MKSILGVFLIFFSIFSFDAKGCYYDFSDHLDWCVDQLGWKPYVVNCMIGVTPQRRVGCLPDPGTPPYDQGSILCSYARSLSVFKTCPTLEPERVQTQITPEQTANSCGSIIRTDTQVLSEEISIVGTPFSLVYSSDKVPGRKTWYQATIPITNLNYASNGFVDYEELKISIAGQYISQNFAPAADLKYNFIWDGKDNNGNPVSGSVTANVTVSEIYIYPPSYAFSSNWSIGYWEYLTGSSNPISYAAYSTDSNFIIGSIFGNSNAIGGWNLNVRHQYDPVRSTLYKGDGGQENSVYSTKSNGDHWVVSSDRSEIYVFDGNFNHLSTKDAMTGVTLYTFTMSLGLLTKVEDKYGNETTFHYSGSNLISITSPNGHGTAITTDTNGYIDSVTNPASEVYEMTYTSDGLLLTFETPAGIVSTMTYDSSGLLLTNSNSAGSSTMLDKELTSTGYKVTETTELGRTIIHDISISGGQYNRQDTYSNQAYKSYGSDFDQKSLSVSGSGVPTYGHSSKTDPRFHNLLMPYYFYASDGGSKSWYYDEYLSLSDINDPFSFSTLVKTWTSAGKTYQSTYSTSSNSITEISPLSKTITKTLNTLGDIASLQVGSLTAVDFTYDQQGRLTSIAQGASRTTDFTYNSTTGFLSSIENALGQVTSFTYDNAGRITSQLLPDLRSISYSYDLDGNITSITPPGRTAHALNYNGFNLISSYVPPMVQSPSNVSTTYAYNDDRQLTTITRPDSQSIVFNYNANGNLDDITLPNGTRSFTYSSGVISGLTSEDFYTSYPSWSGSKIVYDYVTNGTVTYNFSYSYNTENLVSNESVTVGMVNYPVSFTFDDDTHLISAGDTTYIRSTSTGAIEEMIFSDMKQTYGYSSTFGELSSIDSVYNNSTTTYQTDYTRDHLGRITQKIERYGTGTTYNYAYTYDSSGRLTTVTRNGSPFSSYSYDSNSNRTSQTINGVTTNATYDDQDRLVTFGNKTFTYNLNGEVATMSTISPATTTNYTYDVFGNLKQVVLPNDTINYHVDASNRRMAKLVNSSVVEYYVWNSNNQLIGIADNQGSLSARYVYGSKSHSPDYVIKGTDRFQIVSDHLGSPVQVINADTGTIAQEIKYDEFGNILSDTNPGFTPFGFAGCLYDQDTKLCRFGARDYDASIGRWLSKDPILFAGGDTNLYGYVFQDPVNFIDPFGTDAYRTNFGHGYLVIDNPNRAVGGSYVFTFGPKDPNLLTYLQAAAGQPLAAEASVGFFPKGTNMSFLGMEVPFSRMTQGPAGDAATLNRALNFTRQTNAGGNYYNLLNAGGNGYNCIGAARQVQCGNSCGGL